MATEIEVIERQLTDIAPTFEEALYGSGVPVQRFKRSVIMSCEKTPKLLECTRQSLFTAAGTAAILQLECDGTTGQAFLLPFRNTKKGVTEAQCLIGYKGYNTLGARAGCTINGEVVREDDEFDFELGSRGFIHHKPRLGSKKSIIAAWALLMHPTRPPVPMVISIDDILAIKEKSAAKSEGFSPWNDAKIGFPAMAAKSAKRRLHRAMPLNTEMDARYHLAAAMEERREEMGQHAYIVPGPKLVTDGHEITPHPAPGVIDLAPADLHIIGDDGQKITARTKEEFKARWLPRIAGTRSKKELNGIVARNKDALDAARKHAPAEVDEIRAAYHDKLKTWN